MSPTEPRRQRKSRGPQGEANVHHKLTAADVVAIRADSRWVEEIARDYDVTTVTIYQILNGVTWSHLPGAPQAKTKRPRKPCKPRARGDALTPSQAQAILDARAGRTRHTSGALAQQYGVSRQTIQNIWHGRAWKHLQPSAETDEEHSPFMHPPRLSQIEE